jgi:hypothetical protein
MTKRLLHITTILSLVISLLLPAAAFARGEKYTWVDQNTIRAEGGIYPTAANFIKLDRDDASTVPKIECSGTRTLPRIEVNKSDYPGTGDVDGTLVPDADTAACGDPTTSIRIIRSATATPGAANDATDRPSLEGECDAGPLSWFLCSVFRWMIDGIEKIETGLILPFLKLEPLSTDTSNSTYQIWRQFRLLSNVAFVIVFLFIIFTNITSLWVDYYTVKKTLPRLVVAAVMVQFSYWIVGFAIDATNAVGAGIGEIVLSPLRGQAQFEITALTGTLGIVGLLMAAFAAGGAILSGGIFIVALGAFFAVIAVFFTLVLRQVLVTLLLILAPLAFVAWILPNTEGWFKRWYRTLTQVLIMYPLIVLLLASGRIFGAAAVAAEGGGAGSNELRSIVSLVANVVPLFLIPATFKFAGDILQGLVRLVDVLDDLGKTRTEKTGAYDRYKKRVDQRRIELASGQGVKIFPGVKPVGKNRFAAQFGRGLHSGYGTTGNVRAMADFARDRAEWSKRLDEENFTFEAFEVLSRGTGWGQNKVATTTDAATRERYRQAIARAKTYENINPARAAAALWLGDKGAIGDADRAAIFNYTQPTEAGKLIRQQVWGQAKEGARKSSVHLAYTDINTGHVDRNGLRDYVVTQNLGTWANYSKAAYKVMDSERILDEMATQSYQQRQLLVNLLGPRGAAPEQQAIIREVLSRTRNQAPPQPPAI